MEKCPACNSEQYVRRKMLVLVEAWENADSTDRRMLYAVPLRVGAVKAAFLREQPLQQFIDAYYCDACDTGLVSEMVLMHPQNRHETIADKNDNIPLQPYRP